MVDLLRHHIKKHKRPVKYLIAGGAAATVELSLLYFFTDILGIWYLISASLAFAVAFFVSFFLQKFWTFRDMEREKMYHQMTLYFALALSNLFINTGLMYLLVDGFKIWYMLAQVIAGGLIACESYLVNVFFIFNKAGRAAKTKVLIATGIYPPDIGGPATMLKALAESLRREDFLIKIITYAADGGAAEGVYKIKRRRFKALAFLSYFFHLWALAGWADMIYVTDTYSVGYFAYLLNKITGRKYLVRFAGDSAWETAVARGETSDYIIDFQRKKYGTEIEKIKDRQKKILLGAAKVVAVSDFMSNLAQTIGVQKENIEVIYNSVDFLPGAAPGDGAAEIKKRLGGGKIIMTACRLTPWKGVDGLIKILPKIRSKFGAVKLVVLGEGGELPKLKLLAEESGVAGEVEFLGKIEHERILNYYQAADLFILNTNYEGLSHTLLEVMKAGVPLVATKVGGNPEVISDGQEGILVKYNDLAALAEAVTRILDNPDLAKALTAKAKAKLRAFSWPKAVERTAEALRSAARL
jgi:glycosyltransferase involved in cell wall biosynthesis/putative flippase GtrA